MALGKFNRIPIYPIFDLLKGDNRMWIESRVRDRVCGRVEDSLYPY